jgi:hypothetical protein
VAEAVVDRLEVVQVQQEQGRRRPGRVAEAAEGLAQPPGEPGPVGQPGERVDAGPAGQLGGQVGPFQGQRHLGAEAVQGGPGLVGDQRVGDRRGGLGDRGGQPQQLGRGGGGHLVDGGGVGCGQQGGPGRGEHPLAFGGAPPTARELQAHDRSFSAEWTPQAGAVGL